jgi:hypothetical protein
VAMNVARPVPGQKGLAPKAYRLKFANVANIGTSREGMVPETRSVYC